MASRAKHLIEDGNSLLDRRLQLVEHSQKLITEHGERDMLFTLRTSLTWIGGLGPGLGRTIPL